MALGTEIKLFTVGKEVYIAKQVESKIYTPYRAIVDHITRGYLHLRLVVNGEIITANPNDRKLSFTYNECLFICELLNGR